MGEQEGAERAQLGPLSFPLHTIHDLFTRYRRSEINYRLKETNRKGEHAMRYLLALFFPWAVFFTMGKIGQGILCLILQLTIVGWLPATIWAMVSVGSYNADKRTDRIVNAMSQAPLQPAADPRRI